MKTRIHILVQALIMLIMGSTVAWGQRHGTYQTHQDGNWSDENTWEEVIDPRDPLAVKYPAMPPSNSDDWGKIVVSHNVTMDLPELRMDELRVTGTLDVTGSLIVINGPTLYDMILGSAFPFSWGHLKNCGNIKVEEGAKVDAWLSDWRTYNCSSITAAASTNSLNSGSISNLGEIRMGNFTYGGGSVTGNSFLYSSDAALALDLPADSTSMASFWPGTNGPRNLYVRGSGITLKTPRTVNNFYLSDTMDCTNLTVNGNLEIQPGGLVTGAPTYGKSSQLWYHTGGTYARSAEWSADSGAGYPANVFIQGTILDYPNGSRVARAISGELSISNNGALRMDYGNIGVNNPLTVGGDMYLQGTLSLGDAPGGDLHVKGREWIHGEYCTFVPNSRAVIFDGCTEQIISGPATFDGLNVSNPAGVRLYGGWSMTVNQKLTFTAGNLVIERGALTLGGTVLGASSDRHVVTSRRRSVRHLIAPQDSFQFPIGPTATSYNPVTITNISTNAQPRTFYAGVIDSISHPLPLTAAVLRREWKLEDEGTGEARARLTFQWEASDAVIGQFNPAAGVAIGWYDPWQSKWIETAATYDPGPPHRATASFARFFGGEFVIGNLGALTSVAAQKEAPRAFALYQNSPNPFNPSTTIRYAIPHAGYVTLKVYDLVGIEIETLVNEKQSAGEHAIRWNLVGLPSGVYFYRLEAEGFAQTKKLLLMK